MPIESLQRAPAVGSGQEPEGKDRKGQAAADPAFAALLALFMGTQAAGLTSGRAAGISPGPVAGENQVHAEFPNPDPGPGHNGDASAAVSLDQALTALKSDPDLMSLVRLNPELAKTLQMGMTTSEARPAAFGEILEALQVAVETAPTGHVGTNPMKAMPETGLPAPGAELSPGVGAAATAAPAGSARVVLPAAGLDRAVQALAPDPADTVQARMDIPADPVRALTEDPAGPSATVSAPGATSRSEASPEARERADSRAPAVQQTGLASTPAPDLPLVPASPEPAQAGGATTVAQSQTAEGHTNGPSLIRVYTPDQLVDAVARSAAESGPGHYTVTLRLHPEHLGEVRLRLQVNGREVHTVMQVAQPEARAALESRGEQLRQGLDQAGLTLVGFQVSTGSGQSGRPGERERRDPVESLPTRARRTAGPAGQAPQVKPGRQPGDRTRRSGRLDTIA